MYFVATKKNNTWGRRPITVLLRAKEMTSQDVENQWHSLLNIKDKKRGKIENLENIFAVHVTKPLKRRLQIIDCLKSREKNFDETHFTQSGDARNQSLDLVSISWRQHTAWYFHLAHVSLRSEDNRFDAVIAAAHLFLATNRLKSVEHLRVTQLAVTKHSAPRLDGLYQK